MGAEYTKPKLLLVEGADEVSFCSTWLADLGKGNTVKTESYGGKDKLRIHLRTVADTTSFKENVTSVGILRDADNDYDAALRAIKSAVYLAGLSVSQTDLTAKKTDLQISAFILCNTSKYGRLEEMILEAIAEDPLVPCMEDYFLCLNDMSGTKLPEDYGKAVLDIFLASQYESIPKHEFWYEEPVRLSTAFKRHHLNLAHSVYNELKQFLQNL